MDLISGADEPELKRKLSAEAERMLVAVRKAGEARKLAKFQTVSPKLSEMLSEPPELGAEQNRRTDGFDDSVRGDR